jgi:2-iminobutanoate/2-iminopropanoate deaminase
MNKRIISSDKAPKAIGPYSQGVEANGFVFLSGQIPLDPATGALVPGGVQEQAEQVIQNIKAVLEAAGCSLKNVVKASCFLMDLNDFKAFNEVYMRHFTENCPARSTFQVAKLPAGASVEIEVIAVKPNSPV